MARTKKCNSIVHFTNMDGYRAYYEKPDVITFYGVQMSLTEAAARAFVELGKMKLQEKKTAVIAGFLGQEPVWPPHNLLCECGKCTVKHHQYAKGIKG